MQDLTEEERARVAAQVEFFMELVARKYDISPSEVVDAVKWVRERKEFADKVRAAGIVSLVGLLASAVALALWEGLRSMILKGQ